MKKLSALTTVLLGLAICMSSSLQAYPSLFTIIDVVGAVYRSFVTTEAKDPDIEFDKFTRKYAPPKEIQDTLERNSAQLAQQIRYQRSVDSIEEDNRKIFVKIGPSDFANPHLTIEINGVRVVGHSIERVINAVRLRNCIAQKKLQRLTVPQKYIYEFDGIWMCIAEGISPAQTEEQFTLEEVQELATIAEETGYSDWHVGNVQRTSDGTIAIIDTENRSFRWPRWCTRSTAACICRPNSNSLNPRMQPAAKAWIRDHYNDIRLVSFIKNICRPALLPQASRFDDADIDFEAAKDGHKRYNKRLQEEAAQ